MISSSTCVQEWPKNSDIKLKVEPTADYPLIEEVGKLSSLGDINDSSEEPG